MTNAEWIRSLSDEDLAGKLNSCPDDVRICPGIRCRECWLFWLQRERDDDDEEVEDERD